MTTTSPSTHRATSPATTGGGLRGATASEWTKLWSVRTAWWSLLSGVLLMAAAAGQLAIYVANANTDSDPTNDQGIVTTGSIAIDAVELAQFAVITVAMLVITAEYSTGTIRATLQWIPSRGRLLLAKTAVVAGVTFALGTALGALGAAVAAPVLGEWGRFDLAETLGDALTTGVYLALISVFTLGIGAALRGAVGTLVTVFLLVAIVPSTLRLPDLGLLNAIADALPGAAGEHFMAGEATPYPPVVGLLILTAWAAAALIAALRTLKTQDA